MATRPDLSVVGGLSGMELSYLSVMTEREMILRRVHTEPAAPAWPALAAGRVYPRADTLCHRMLAGAPATSADAGHDPAYAGAALVQGAGITSYLGVPVIHDGAVLGTLCGADRESVAVGDRAVDAMRALAPLFAAELAPPVADISLTRLGDRWRVNVTGAATSEGHDAEDLTAAMVLADLLAADLDGATAGPATRPTRVAPEDDELSRLRISVAQLEHALAARVIVEQAIGVLAERRNATPRAAFEMLRSSARGAGRRVHLLAGEVVASTTGTAAGLTAALARGNAQPPMPGSAAGSGSGLGSPKPSRPTPAPPAQLRRVPTAPVPGPPTRTVPSPASVENVSSTG